MFANNNYEIVINALQTLAGVCDGARTEDGVGFNGVDSAFGKDLAARGALTEKQLIAAHKMLKKYSRQLSNHGIVLPKVLETESKTFNYNINRDWIVIRFNHIPDADIRNTMKVAGAKYMKEQNNAWVLRNTIEAGELVQWMMDKLELSHINGVEYQESEGDAF